MWGQTPSAVRRTKLGSLESCLVVTDGGIQSPDLSDYFPNFALSLIIQTSPLLRQATADRHRSLPQILQQPTLKTKVFIVVDVPASVGAIQQVLSTISYF